jgi:hypothetical protein
MKKVYMLLLYMTFYECRTSSEYASKTLVKSDGARLLVSNEKALVQLRYYSDYWFHPLNKTTTLFWHEKFIKHLFLRDPELLYTAHTILDPYYSTMGLLYKKTDTTSLLAHLTKTLQTSHLKRSSELIGTYRCEKLSYLLQDEALKVDYHCRDYYFQHDQHVLRVVFWTLGTNESLFEEEVREIIRTLHLYPAQPSG